MSRRAASDLANIGSTISSANAAALAPTSGVLAAGADEVSATIAALFGAHAQAYQALSAQAASFHQQFVQLMSGGSAQYALTEAANASPLQTVEQGVMSGDRCAHPDGGRGPSDRQQRYRGAGNRHQRRVRRVRRRR